MMELTKTTREDLETLFIFQTNTDGIWMAAFMPENPFDKEAYMEKWIKIIENPGIRMRTLRVNSEIVGSVAHFEMFGEMNVAYWIDQQYWGNGYATKGLSSFVKDTEVRPLFARVAFDNIGSQRVLEKCGFKKIGEDRGFANARKMEIDEFIFKLE